MNNSVNDPVHSWCPELNILPYVFCGHGVRQGLSYILNSVGPSDVQNIHMHGKPQCCFFFPMRTKYLSACTELESWVWSMSLYPSLYPGRTEIETSYCLETVTSYWQSVDTVCCCYRGFSYISFRNRLVETRQRSDEDRTSIQCKLLSMMKMMLFMLEEIIRLWAVRILWLWWRLGGCKSPRDPWTG